jgi:thiol-disulfide isomerase/thioredoxin
VYRLPDPRRAAARAADAIGACVRQPARSAAALAAAAAVVVSLTACSGGAIAQSTPVSNGTSFVAGGSGASYFAPAGRHTAPAVSGTTLTGQKLNLTQFHGHVLVLNFWGSWCEPCRVEAPALAALSARYQKAGVRFVGIDIRDNPASANAFLRNFRIGYPSLNDPNDEIALRFQGTVPPLGIPTSLVIDPRGRIAARIVGGVSYDGLHALLTKITAESS